MIHFSLCAYIMLQYTLTSNSTLKGSKLKRNIPSGIKTQLPLGGDIAHIVQSGEPPAYELHMASARPHDLACEAIH